MRRYTFRSGLVRFLHEGRMRTAAVTHCTDKAWRVMNKELGVAWLPKNVIRWSEVAQQFCVIDIAFSITSKEKALWQMDTINRLTERGEWFVGSEWHYEIQKDELNPVDGQPRFVRDIMIKCVETGVLVLYRMIESPLNSMYISK